MAFRYGDDELTYADVDRRTDRLAAALARLGIGKGARIAYLGPNHPAAPELMFAAGILGAIYVPLNWRLAPRELEFILHDSAPEVLVWHEQFDAKAAEVLAQVFVPHKVRLGAGNRDGEALDHAALVAAAGSAPDVAVAGDDVAMIQYTSGTSGRPKGVMLTHDNLVWNTINLLIDVDLRTDEVSLVAAPLFHTAGLNNHVLPVFLKGGTAVIVPSWNPDEALELVERHRITSLLGVPTMFLGLTQSPGWAGADLSSLRTIMCGGSPVPPALADQFRKLGLVFQPGYGLTETSPNATFLRAGMADEKAGTVGAPCFFVDVRVVDADLEDLPAGHQGEILVKGPNVTRGYWQLEDATRQALTGDGWLHTGDVGATDDDGYVEIKDRLKDMIISGGENIYPAEVEAAMYEHPDVAECAVIGVADPRWGEVGLAFVVPRTGARVSAEELEEHLRARLAHYKVPKHYRIVDGLPHNASGKLLKSELRTMYAARSTA